MSDTRLVAPASTGEPGGGKDADSRYKRLFENSAEPILIIEGDRFVDCNQAAVDMLGYADKSAVLQCHPSEISPEYQPDGQLSVEKANGILARASKKTYQCFEWTHVRADGTLFPVEVALTAIPGENGFTLHTTWRDISERKLLERELRHSQKMEAVGKLAGGIAHDFNNQLVPILGFSEMLNEALQDDNELSGIAGEIHHAATIAATMVNKLLAISRKSEKEAVVLDIDEAVADLTAILRSLVGEHVTLDIRAADKPLWVRLVRGDIEQILMNLVANSRDALPNGGNISIVLSPIRDSGVDFARVKVSDNGCGMSADVLRHMYEPFFTTKEIGSGTGLGMSTVYSLVAEAGGRIDASSESGRGTTVVVDLPSASEEESTAQTISLETDKAEEAVDRAFHPHVLVVEDNAQVALFVAQVLRSHGFRVSAAENGKVALEYLATETPDLILTDVIMDQMSGPAMIRQLESDGVDIPVLFMSGHTDDRLSSSGLNTDRFELLRKPFTADELVKQIWRSLKRD